MRVDGSSTNVDEHIIIQVKPKTSKHVNYRRYRLRAGRENPVVPEPGRQRTATNSQKEEFSYEQIIHRSSKSDSHYKKHLREEKSCIRSGEGLAA